MQHFEIVLSLARAALEKPTERTYHQLERLRNVLAETDKGQAAKLSRLIKSRNNKKALTPLLFDEMRVTADAVRSELPGEILTRNSALPRDKDTSAPLARILFPDETDNSPPFLTSELEEAISDLLNEWTMLERLRKYGESPSTRCLLYGPPGVGKTRIARYIAAQLDLPCVEVRLDGLISSFLGNTSRNIASLFAFANRYRCVLFLDEFDALAKARDDSHELGEIKRVVNTLLQQLDQREGRGFTLAATNHEQLLDEAVWRRFDARVWIVPPNAVVRAAMVPKFLQPFELTELQIRVLVYITESLSGSELESLCRVVKRYVVLHGVEDSYEIASPLLLNALNRYVVLNPKQLNAKYKKAIDGDREELINALKQAGLTQSEKAKFIGVSQSTISRVKQIKKSG